ncbi:MAG: hypothetical protein BAJATHORv1_10182 [Candidatus Thorarchaeota archaeon]|nr:MAG: hypothetical protein BAJATHORv1_10182 [Candidatus Thorarchaeota archaeon]
MVIFLTAGDSKNSDSVDLHFECIMCGRCCKVENLVITVTGTDIVRIARVLDFGPDEILKALDFYLLKGDRATPEGMRDFPLVTTEKGPAYMALKKMEDGSCIFLKDNKCMIHPVRPAVCASFPFSFQRKSGELVWGLNAMKDICPGIGLGNAVKKSYLEAVGTEVLENLSIYTDFVKDWNSINKRHTVRLFIKSILESPVFYA